MNDIIHMETECETATAKGYSGIELSNLTTSSFYGLKKSKCRPCDILHIP